MAPGATSTTEGCRPLGDEQENVFEGPEKKLVVQFAQHAFSMSSKHGTFARRKDINANCKPSCKLRPSQTLRGLRKDQITAILNAARCTVLSVVSNRSTDAYLLSESSMFVSDFRITIKTCGTTTLLRALPVILRIVFETIGLEVLYVMFSRVAYFFPEAQSYPHDCFDHEVSYLDHHLSVKGKVFEAVSHTGSKWFLYFAGFRSSCRTNHTDSVIERYTHSSPYHSVTAKNDRTLEIYMFDLDPSVMKRFMFHDRPHMTGSDNLRFRTTSYGVKSLLSGHDVIDGYNFAPCGYSMNALKEDSYYTIHVSPEHATSYVSFETTVNLHSFTGLTTAVVKLFRPDRFTVSCIQLGPGSSQDEDKALISWGLVSKLLSPKYSLIRDPSALGFDATPRCFATVGSFQKVIVNEPTRKHEQYASTQRDTIANVLLSVAVKHDARLSRYFEPEEPSGYAGDREDNYIPKYVVDLSRVARNWSMLRTAAPQNWFKLRYSVRSNADKGVLSLLNGLNVAFEAADAYEVDLLVSLGVAKSRIILVTPVLTSSLVARFHLIGIVALFDIPAKAVQERLLQAGVEIELRIVDYNGLQELHATISRLAKNSLTVTCIALDSSPDSFSNSTYWDPEISEHLAHIRRINYSGLPGKRNDLTLHLGASWISDILSSNSVDGPAAHTTLHGFQWDGIVSIDASHSLLTETISISARIVGRRTRHAGCNASNNSSPLYSYYLSDGAYGAFSHVLMSSLERSSLLKIVRPHVHVVDPMQDGTSSRFHKNGIHQTIVQKGRQNCSRATLYGPTCDALDWMWKGDLPLLDVGDSVSFQGLGAYSSSSRTEFNGFGRLFNVSYMVAVADL